MRWCVAYCWFGLCIAMSAAGVAAQPFDLKTGERVWKEHPPALRLRLAPSQQRGFGVGLALRMSL